MRALFSLVSVRRCSQKICRAYSDYSVRRIWRCARFFLEDCIAPRSTLTRRTFANCRRLQPFPQQVCNCGFTRSVHLLTEELDVKGFQGCSYFCAPNERAAQYRCLLESREPQ